MPHILYGFAIIDKIQLYSYSARLWCWKWGYYTLHRHHGSLPSLILYTSACPSSTYSTYWRVSRPLQHCWSGCEVASSSHGMRLWTPWWTGMRPGPMPWTPPSLPCLDSQQTPPASDALWPVEIRLHHPLNQCTCTSLRKLPNRGTHDEVNKPRGHWQAGKQIARSQVRKQWLGYIMQRNITSHTAPCYSKRKMHTELDSSTSSALSLDLHAMKVCAPIAASPLAVSYPMPELPPVTMATLPDRSTSGYDRRFPISAGQFSRFAFFAK